MNTRLHIVRVALLAVILFGGAIAGAAPLHIYLTYSGEPETTIDINIMLPRAADSVEVYYDTEERGEELDRYRHVVKAGYVQTPIELADRRTMYVAPLQDLAPDTVYYFITNDTRDGLSKPRKFKTLPGGTAPFRFVNGGDMGVDGAVFPLLTLAGKQNPDFAIIGGDIAYANGMLGATSLWDAWLDNWDTHMVTTDGRMIPIVTAIGNHETNYYRTDDKSLNAPWYVSLFGRQGEEIYYARKFGDNVAFFSLDSGHLNPHGGAQAAWLTGALAAHRDVKYKFAAYHVPLYPAHRPYDGTGSALGRQHWGPLFDQFGLTVGFEHHDHVLKRSKPIRNNEVAETGTIYVGDGCFGRSPRDVDPQPRWYNKLEGSVPHFWVVDVADSGLSFQAIDASGTTWDTFTLP